MKFLAVFALVFACASASAVWPYAANWAHDDGQWKPWADGSWNGYNTGVVGVRSWAAAPVAYSAYPAGPWGNWGVGSYAAHVAAPRAVVAAHAPVAYAAPAYAYSAPAAVYAHGHAATYTAANRGSVHTAPLAGHAVSQTSLNLAPAPGTH